MGDVPITSILWGLVIMHSVNHRRQLSAYLGIMGEKVPSIYGPSLDEPWMWRRPLIENQLKQIGWESVLAPERGESSPSRPNF
jgi:hypothetical protein